MHDNRQIAEERLIAFHIRQEVIGVLGVKAVATGYPDGTMLAAQVADLAGGRVLDVAGGRVGAAVGVEVLCGRVAVAVFGDGFGVDVVLYSPGISMTITMSFRYDGVCWFVCRGVVWTGMGREVGR